VTSGGPPPPPPSNDPPEAGAASWDRPWKPSEVHSNAKHWSLAGDAAVRPEFMGRHYHLSFFIIVKLLLTRRITEYRKTVVENETVVLSPATNCYHLLPTG